MILCCISYGHTRALWSQALMEDVNSSVFKMFQRLKKKKWMSWMHARCFQEALKQKIIPKINLTILFTFLFRGV